MPNATPRVRNVAAVSRDDVDMQVENGLTGVLPDASTDEHEQLMLGPAASRVSRAELVQWLRDHTTGVR